MDFQIHPLQQKFNLLYKEQSDLYHEAAVTMGLSDSALAILYTICELGNGYLQKDICEHCFLTKQTVHSSVRKLEREGYLSLNPGKGRDMHLSLTDAGLALAQKTVIPLAQAESLAMSALSPEDQAELIRLTEAYTAALKIHLQQI